MNVKLEIEKGEALICALTSVKEFSLIGSAMYLPDPVDVDFAVMLQPGFDAMQVAGDLMFSGWDQCGEYDTAEGEWCAVRKGNVNVMLTHNREFYNDYLCAMEVCKFLNLKDKQERIGVCKIVRDGLSAEGVWEHFPLKRPGALDDEL